MRNATCTLMRRKHLEMFLQKVPPIRAPKPNLEQYNTPANLAADILFMAYQAGEIDGKVIGDLGCGSGIFAIGAAILGAKAVRGYDIDESVVTQAKKNAEALLPKSIQQPTFEQKDVSKIEDRFDVVFQNPPFGAQNPGADVPFIEASIRCSKIVYSIHNGNTEDFLIKKITEMGAMVTYKFKDRITIPHTFEFHSKEKQDIEVIVLKIASNK
jgi:putative methylase